MLSLVLRKVLHVVPVLLLVSLGTLLLVDLVPGDPGYAILGEQATQEQVAQVHDDLGLDDNVLLRYGRWLGDAVRGDLGKSYVIDQDVSTTIGSTAPISFQLAIMGLGLALLLAVPLGILAAAGAEGRFDRWTNGLASGLISSPPFLTALLLVYLLSIRFRLFPVTGWVPFTEDLGDNLRSAFLPAVTLALTQLAVLSRLLRSDMVVTLREDYILAAKAKGISRSRILLRHALRPSSFSLVTLSGVALGHLIAGTVIVEVIFSIPGLGRVVFDSISSKDIPMLQGVVLFLAVVYVTLNVVIDLIYAWLDPRVRAA